MLALSRVVDGNVQKGVLPLRGALWQRRDDVLLRPPRPLHLWVHTRGQKLLHVLQSATEGRAVEWRERASSKGTRRRRWRQRAGASGKLGLLRLARSSDLAFFISLPPYPLALARTPTASPTKRVPPFPISGGA